MNEIQWHQEKNRYVAQILGYTAVIVAETFDASVEKADGTVLREWAARSEEDMDFAQAEQHVAFLIVDLEQAGDAHTAQAGMLATLDLCRSKLPADIHISHAQRLANMRRWVIDREEQWATARANNGSESVPLDWVERTSTRHEVETDYGRAIIVEERPRKSKYRINATGLYTAHIQDVSGAAYRSYGNFIDFVAADAWIRQALDELSDPRVLEVQLDAIRFTLDICKRSLPFESSALHFQRLEYLEMLISDALL